MTEKLIGYDEGTVDGSVVNDYFCLYKFTAAAAGSCTEVRIKVSGNGSVKTAVYADNAGEPGARLAKQDTSMAVVAGWNTISLESPCNITADAVYWLAFNSSAQIVGYDLTAGISRYKAAAYGSFTFPDPAGTGFTPATNTVGFIAGWGIEIGTKTSADNGSGSESVTLTEKVVFVAETGVAVETGGLVVAKNSSDGGAGSEVGGLAKSLNGADGGAAIERLEMLSRKAGTDVELRGQHGQTGLPHKEVKL